MAITSTSMLYRKCRVSWDFTSCSLGCIFQPVFLAFPSPTDLQCRQWHFHRQWSIVVKLLSIKCHQGPTELRLFFPANHCTIWFIDVCTHRNRTKKEVSVASVLTAMTVFLCSDRVKKHVYTARCCHLQNIQHKLYLLRKAFFFSC